jgi:putative ABC transport system permease protein
MELNINNWKLAIRNLIKQRRATSLNIIGLAFGFAAVIFLSTYVYRELTYDSFHKNPDRIFKPEFEIIEADKDIDMASNITLEQVQLFRENVPGIKALTFLNYSRWDWDNGAWIEYGGNKYNIERLAFSDKYFDEVFSFKTNIGNLRESLDEPDKLVLTKEVADKIFGAENPVGKEVVLNNKPIVIGAILDDIPSNSSIQLSGLLSYKSAQYFFGKKITDWSNIPFIRIKNKTTPVHVGESFSKALLLSLPEKELKELNPVFSTNLVSIRDLYFRDASDYDPIKHGSKSTAYILLGIGVLILFLAIINYNNLLLVTSLKWKKDFGIQQILGADKACAKKQLFIKGTLITVTAFIVAVLIISLSLSWFNHLVNYPLKSSDFGNLPSIIIAIALLLFTILFSGLIPSLTSSFSKPLILIKGYQTEQKNNSSVWKGLVTFQLFVSIALIIGALAISKQIHYGLTKDLGINVQNIVTVPVAKLGDKQQAYLDLVAQNGQTKSHCKSSSYINTFTIWGGKLKAPGVAEESVLYNMIRVNNSFVKTLGLNITQGRDFRNSTLADEGAMIVNESFVKHFNLENPLESSVRGCPIVGVIEDYNFNSLHHKIEPAIFWNSPKHAGLASMQFMAGNKAGVKSYMDFLKSEWENLNTGKPFEYEFLDDRLASMYQKDIVLAKSIISFSVFAIFIACLGIFGLLTFIMEMKVKEIGIRKVNGAKVQEILKLVNLDLVKWISIAFLVACPIAYYAMHKWLENFAYKTTLSWWIFALAGVLALGIALLTVSWQSWRAATRNPVEALRYE